MVVPTLFIGGEAIGETVISCGASKGYSFFLQNSSLDYDAGWSEDGISNGKIILVKEGEDFDILFDDIIGGYGYREDGADVFMLGLQNGKITILIVHYNYSDLYTFDLLNNEVVWASQKIAPHLVNKGSLFRADCE